MRLTVFYVVLFTEHVEANDKIIVATLGPQPKRLNLINDVARFTRREPPLREMFRAKANGVSWIIKGSAVLSIY